LGLRRRTAVQVVTVLPTGNYRLEEVWLRT
jgi:hypothetical protein